MKIGIFSDIHLHKFTEFSGNDGRQRLRDGVKLLEYILKLFRKEKCDVVIFAGDLFHSRRTLDIDSFNSVSSVFRSEKVGGAKLVAIPGNHDWYDRACTTHSLDFLREYGWNVVDKRSTLWFGDTEVLAIPHMEKGKLDAALSSFKADKKYKRRIAIVHTTPKGSQSATGHYFSTGVDLESYGRKFDFIFCGDIHKPQERGNVIIVGAPMHHNFGDAGDERRCILFDTERNRIRSISLRGHFPEFVVTNEPDSTTDGNYYRLTVSASYKGDKELGPNVTLVRSVSTGRNNKGDRIDNNAISSPERIITEYANKYGRKLKRDKLIKIGMELI